MAGRLMAPGSGKHPAPALAREDLHLRGPEWRTIGSSLVGRAAVAPAERKCLPCRGSRRRRAAHPFRSQTLGKCAVCAKEFWRADRWTHPQRRLGFSPETSTLRSVWPLSVTHLSPPPGCRVCAAASAGGSFAPELSAALTALGW